MKIAFTSCSSTNLVPQQPIWDDILSSGPDKLVLLGDNFYNDVPDVGMGQLKAMGTWEFAEHMFVRYQQQLRQPRFRNLVAAPGIEVHAIWDDHDFAWNDANGGQMLASPVQSDKVKISTSFMRAFRQALAARDLSTFPDSPGDAAFWTDIMAPVFIPLGAYTIPLESDGRSWLHLTDGRTLRKKPEMLGVAQRGQLEQAFAAHPGALQVLASGSTFSQGDGWHKYASDRKWLAQAAGDQGWLMLSGDVHSNGLLEHKLSANGRLVEATASGAAIVAWLNPILTGPEVRNFGLLEIERDHLLIRLLAFNKVVTEVRYERTTAGDLIVK
jgi:phosphodiesterase/alkaline phosphatase D-like protein